VEGELAVVVFVTLLVLELDIRVGALLWSDLGSDRDSKAMLIVFAGVVKFLCLPPMHTPNRPS
jgi:hypothetical protein